MKLLVYVTKLFVGDMGINLGGLDVFVSQHFLNASDIGPRHQ